MYQFLGIKFTKQGLMRTVLLALLPLILFGTYSFGLRVLVLLLVNIITAVCVEYLFLRKEDKPVSEAALVTATLFTLTLPATVPFWVSIIGVAFGIFFGKMVFGGFGRNVFNPALVGRAFIYISFSGFMTGEWPERFNGFPGGFTHWVNKPIEALSEATPMLINQQQGVLTDYKSLFFGLVNGSIGEGSKLLIILALIYLIYKKAVFKENIIGMALGFVVTTLLFTVLGVESVSPILFGLLSGGFLFGLTFMITDPVSSAKTPGGRYMSSFIAGLVTVVIRSFAIFPGAVMFAILIANMFAPILDELAKYMKNSKKKGENDGKN